VYILVDTFDNRQVRKYAGDVGLTPLAVVENKIAESSDDQLMCVLT